LRPANRFRIDPCGRLGATLVNPGWITMETTDILTVMILVVISLILAAGTAWSHVKRRLTGLVNVDDVED
jgi:hypothetical protein